MNLLLIPELRELVFERNQKDLVAFIGKINPALAAESIDGLRHDEISWILEALPDDLEVNVFVYLPEDVQLAVAGGAGRQEIAKLLDRMAPDDRAEFARNLPKKTLDEILPLMAQAARRDITRLLTFEPDSSGARMNTSYAAVDLDDTCGNALERVRHEAPAKETIYTIYVIDPDRTLRGVIELKELLLAKPDARVRDLMRSTLVSVRADEPAATAAKYSSQYDLLAVPVVDRNLKLLGIVTIDDLVDVMEREATRDILSIGGVEPGALDKSYFENPVKLVVRKRVGWLMLLFVTEMLTGTVLRHYDEALARVVSLAFFIPLLIGTGGNAGSQTVSTIIRSLALGEITTKEWRRIVLREACVGLTMGLLLGAVGVLRSLMWEPSNFALAGTVGLSLVAICTWSNSVAALVPVFAQRAGIDPTVLSAPLIATLVDATGLIIYFNVAFIMIQKLGTPLVHLPQDLSTQFLALADQAPKEWGDRVRDLIAPQTVHPAHSSEWLFPAFAIVVLCGVLLSVSHKQRKQGATK